MAREVDEWHGADDDSAVPPRVKARVWEREQGRCHRCTRKIPAGDAWIIEHTVALINAPGMNRESNLCLTCSWCKPQKDAEDVAIKSINARKRAKHLGIYKPKTVMPGSRASKWKRLLSGQVVLREK